MTDPQSPIDNNGFNPERHFVIPPPEPPRVFYATEPTRDLVTHQPRQPNLAYSALLLGMGVLVLFGISILIGIIGVATHLKLTETSAAMPKASILMEALTFLITYGIAFALFPRYWRRPFGEVIHWNRDAVKQHIPSLIGTGIALSVVAQGLESLLTLPKEMPVDAFFKQPSTIWIIAIFGTFVAPVCEEVFFRGFLLRGFAIFLDWIALPKTPEARDWWQSTSGLTERSMILSGILTSGLFAAMHAAQLGWAWNAVGVLWIVGAGLTWVRIRYNSVAASSVVHAAYNGLLFAIMFVITGGFRHLDKLANH